MELTSKAFENGEFIPEKYTCDGENINPPLEFSNVPEDTKSLVLIMEDPDVPAAVRKEQMYDHWVIFNIPPETETVEEGQSPLGIVGKNTAGDNAYTGPCPPPQFEPTEHRYFFRLYALDGELSLSENITKKEVLNEMGNLHELAEAELMGRYSRD